MKILDAMACGLPVVTPCSAGSTEFCSSDTCYPVDFSLVPVRDCIDARSLTIDATIRDGRNRIAVSLAAQIRAGLRETG